METSEHFKIVETTDREDWLAKRRQYIGASDTPALLGLSPWASPLSVYLDKTGQSPEQPQTEAMEAGLRLERTVTEWFGERTGQTVEMCGELLVSRHWQWMACTLDARIVDPSGGWIPLEIKVTGIGGGWDESPPPHYVAQVQHQLAVTGGDRAVICCLVGGTRLVWADIERDEQMIDAIVSATQEMAANIEHARIPGTTGHKADDRALLHLHPDDNGETVALDNDALMLTERITQLDEYARQAKAAADGLRQRIKAKIGDATFGELPNGARWKWSTTVRKSYTVAAGTSRTLRLTKAK